VGKVLKLKTISKNRDNIFIDYKDKLKKLFPEIEIIGFDPDFLVGHWTEYMKPGQILDKRLGWTENLSFSLVHLILKSHNLHNKSIEVK
jgi:hypothetical protein